MLIYILTAKVFDWPDKYWSIVYLRVFWDIKQLKDLKLEFRTL